MNKSLVCEVCAKVSKDAIADWSHARQLKLATKAHPSTEPQQLALPLPLPSGLQHVFKL